VVQRDPAGRQNRCEKERDPMTPTDIGLVQSSFAKVAPLGDEAGAIFYRRLFEIAPEVRPLFHGDMDEQASMFMSVLTLAVNGLSDFDSVEPALRDLAVRHAGYGVKAEHYAPLGAALIWLMEQNLGDGFTEEVRGAWISVYGAISEVMINAAYGGAIEP
jgi:hemoglobin-like flavoprotein